MQHGPDEFHRNRGAPSPRGRREGRRLRLSLDGSGRLAGARGRGRPRYASGFERSLAREATPVDLGEEVLLPDFTLRHDDGRGAEAAALRQIRRVLVPGGRFVANVPGPAPPPLQAMADALGRHVSPKSASFVDAVFSLHDADELRSVAEEAGFDAVEVESDETPLEFGDPGEFLWHYVKSTPIAVEVAKIDEGHRTALERDFVEACRPHVTDGTLGGAVRMTTLVATK